MLNEESNNEGSSNESGDSSADATNGANAEADASNDQSDAQAPEGESTAGDDENPQTEFVKDNEGKEFIPKEVFEKRLASLTAKRKEAEELLAAIKSNPDVRKQFLGEEEKPKDAAAAPAPTPGNLPSEDGMKPVREWLGGLGHAPEVQAFYKGQVEAILRTTEATIVPYIHKTIQEALGKEVAPLKRYVGESSLKEFEKANPTFGALRTKTLEVMKKFSLPVEQAFVLAQHEAQKAAKPKTPSPTAQGRDKLKNLPIPRRQTSSSGQGQEKMSLSQAIHAALRENKR